MDCLSKPLAFLFSEIKKNTKKRKNDNDMPNHNGKIKSVVTLYF